MVVVIIGATGQLGHELTKTFASGASCSANTVVALRRAELDITDADAVREHIVGLRPDVVFNAAAYNTVDKAESEIAMAFAVNAFGPRNLALACRACGAALVHVSTNYVFDGRKSEPYEVDDLPAPLSVYGASKLAGEHLVRLTHERSYIIRTSAVFGIAGRQRATGNFVESMLRRAQQQSEVRVVNDQTISPTYAVDLATVIKAIVEKGAYGTYHVTNSGACTWFEFCRTVFDRAGVTTPLHPVSTEEFAAPARRPRYSVLSHASLHALGLPALRHWQEALAAYFEERQRECLSE
ncbi:MAG: dTDP-4-dehydrorhamnose reductase [Abditibacteriales bacterium]|nr:dTDP-4-dehydrorhamnose reductase [Abditibacteriales bacterium]MDW8366510.1 dTDP-4-dehydrorhamnose reductase [Abditibacteriales bacterium]